MDKNQKRRMESVSKRIFSIVLGAITLAVMSGTVLVTMASATETITIKCLWQGGNQDVRHELLTKSFKKTHPNVEFEKTVLDSEQHRATARMLMSSSGAPDFIYPKLWFR